MKYTKSILALMTLNLILIFLMIFIANKSRLIEKNNNTILKDISILKENIKVNEIEFIAHKNTSYLRNLYELYINKEIKNNLPKVISLNNISKKEEFIKLVKAKN